MKHHSCHHNYKGYLTVLFVLVLFLIGNISEEKCQESLVLWGTLEGLWIKIIKDYFNNYAKLPVIEGRFHGNLVSGNQPCKWSPTGAITLKETRRRNLPDLIPTMNQFLWGLGRAGHWMGKIGNQSSTSNLQCSTWALKLQIWWPKQWSVQGRDLQRSAEQATAIMVTHASTCQSKPLWPPHKSFKLLDTLSQD